MKRWGWVAAGLGFLSVVVMPLGVGRFVWVRLPPPRDVTTFASTFGDIVGPLFAALAFAGLIYTALMQREELSLQRQELRETREELRRSADAHEASGQVLQEQVRIAQLAARLNAALALLDHYEKLYARLPTGLLNPGDPQLVKKQEHKREVTEGLREAQAEIFRIRAQLLGAVHGSGVSANLPQTSSGTGVMTDPDV